MGISQSLPQTGYVKMVDIWMIFTMSYPFFVIACHCGIEVREIDSQSTTCKTRPMVLMRQAPLSTRL